MKSIFGLFILCIVEVRCYKNHTTLQSIVFTNIPNAKKAVMEYLYGAKCDYKNKLLLMHAHHKGEDVAGTMIIESTQVYSTHPHAFCARITATAAHSDMIRYQPYSFAICYKMVLVSLPGGLDYEYLYLDWYIPVEVTPDLDWDLYFYHT